MRAESTSATALEYKLLRLQAPITQFSEAKACFPVGRFEFWTSRQYKRPEQSPGLLFEMSEWSALIYASIPVHDVAKGGVKAERFQLRPVLNRDRG
ncbi:hypothetical protein [Ponticaulis sp.]|uniref:hypothetical protein n=1 Tax=Ponticaulis sp. TaxID=2020902 RepID=UPI00260DE581|nr:hypothetical protein [Ponticaulis sp.]MDF1680581.1 hypothetical protein [Ponticaulis sp.]